MESRTSESRTGRIWNMSWNELIRRGGTLTRTFLVATALVTTACVTGCGGDDTVAPPGNPDTGTLPDTNVPDTNVADTNVADTNVADTNVADTGVPDTTPAPFAATPQCTPTPGSF